MNYIDEGFYYKVYDLDNGRVLKKIQPFFYSFKKVFRHCRERSHMTLLSSIKMASKVVPREHKALEKMKDKMKTLPSHIFGDPIFIGSSLNYTQDKVITLTDYFEKHTDSESKKIIDLYVNLQEKLWSMGIHDKVFKFQTNYGVTSTGEVAFIDFGECLFSKEEALESALSRKWLNRKKYKNWDNVVLKEYYTNKMNSLMTEENFNNLWNK